MTFDAVASITYKQFTSPLQAFHTHTSSATPVGNLQTRDVRAPRGATTARQTSELLFCFRPPHDRASIGHGRQIPEELQLVDRQGEDAVNASAACRRMGDVGRRDRDMLKESTDDRAAIFSRLTWSSDRCLWSHRLITGSWSIVGRSRWAGHACRLGRGVQLGTRESGCC